MLIKPFCHKQTSVLWHVAGGQLRPVGLQGQTCRFPISFCSGNRGAGRWKNVENPLLLQAKEPVPFWPAQPSWAQSMWKTIGFISKRAQTRWKTISFYCKRPQTQLCCDRILVFHQILVAHPPGADPKWRPKKNKGFCTWPYVLTFSAYFHIF